MVNINGQVSSRATTVTGPAGTSVKSLRQLISLVAGLALISMVGCAGPPAEVRARLGQEFTLALGQTSSIAEEGLKIQFIEVINDSRCPINVTCFWEGRASCLVQFTQEDIAYKVVLNEPGLTDHAEDVFRNYKVAFHLKPYPGEVENISKGDYRLYSRGVTVYTYGAS